MGLPRRMAVLSVKWAYKMRMLARHIPCAVGVIEYRHCRMFSYYIMHFNPLLITCIDDAELFFILKVIFQVTWWSVSLSFFCKETTSRLWATVSLILVGICTIIAVIRFSVVLSEVAADFIHLLCCFELMLLVIRASSSFILITSGAILQYLGGLAGDLARGWHYQVRQST